MQDFPRAVPEKISLFQKPLPGSPVRELWLVGPCTLLPWQRPTSPGPKLLFAGNSAFFCIPNIARLSQPHLPLLPVLLRQSSCLLRHFWNGTTIRMKGNCPGRTSGTPIKSGFPKSFCSKPEQSRAGPTTNALPALTLLFTTSLRRRKTKYSACGRALAITTGAAICWQRPARFQPIIKVSFRIRMKDCFRSKALARIQRPLLLLSPSTVRMP